jgi:hypothetical protein
MKRACQIVLLAGLLFQGVAQAGQVTLYTHDNFNGRAVTVQGATPNLSQFGFNDRASSMVIASGRWEVCVDDDFRGRCAVFERGEYARLSGLNDQISSLREVDGRDRSRRGEQGRGESWRSEHSEREQGWHGQGGREHGWREQGWREQGWREHDQQEDRGRGEQGRSAMLELFSEPNFGGARLPLRRDARSLDEFDFNDQAGSMLVQGGEWEVCVHADFGGQCRVYGPGRYARLGPLDQQISSVRRLR